MFILGIITLALEFIASIGVLLIYKLGSHMDGIALALWTWPLLILAILVTIFGAVNIRKPERRKKAITTTILGGAAIFGFLLYAIHIGFYLGTGHPIFYYMQMGF